MKRSANGSLIVTFDLGGVVVRVCPSYQIAAQRAGVPWRNPKHAACPDEIERLLYEWQVGHLADDTLFAAWADALGARFDASEARRLSSAWLMGEYEGIREIVEQVRKNGVRLACLSNTANHHWRHMLDNPDEYPTLQLLSERFGSHMFGHMKPDPQIFKRFEQAVGARGADVVFFDDREENIAGALARNWRAFRILPNQPPRDQVRQALQELEIL